MKTIEIAGKTILIKDYYCSEENGEYIDREDGKLWLYVYVTDNCNGRCLFCINGEENNKRSVIDCDRFETVFQRIMPHIYGISFTGGEPLLEIETVDRLMDIILTNGFKGEIDLVTNGILLENLSKCRNLPFIDAIHISRHHFDDLINNDLFNASSISIDQLKETMHHLQITDKVVFNCVLQRTGISNLKQIADYLETAVVLGINNVSFIGMYPANDYCTENYINPSDIDFSSDLRFDLWSKLHDHDFCCCCSGDFKAMNRYIRFYYRCPGKQKAAYTRQLVYTADNRLLKGFSGEELFISKD